MLGWVLTLSFDHLLQVQVGLVMKLLKHDSGSSGDYSGDRSGDHSSKPVPPLPHRPTTAFFFRDQGQGQKQKRNCFLPFLFYCTLSSLRKWPKLIRPKGELIILHFINGYGWSIALDTAKDIHLDEGDLIES